ncbi:MAG: hypothetical protein MMC23_007369 [Stictis urceolatum]|nr:hypothetical protein [Stictis urceolata]
MAESEQMAFMKQLVDSDRKVRDKALDTLRLYLTSGRQFTDLELMKLWRGLFYCMYHTPPPRAHAALSASLTTLLLSLPSSLSIPFQRAFWRTHATLYPTLDQHRLDKFLLLMRRYVGGGMQFLAQQGWRDGANGEEEGTVEEWLGLMAEEGAGPLSLGWEGEGKVVVGDGVRYHVLDVWVDEMAGAEVPAALVERMLGPVRRVAKEGRTKHVRKRAKEVLGDKRLADWRREKGSSAEEGDGEEWGGLE